MPNSKISEFSYNGNTYDFKDKDAQYIDIDYEDWLELTPTQQVSGNYDVHNVPNIDGTIKVDLMTKLWENPSPSAAFAGQDILLDLTSFDMVYIQGSDSSCIASKMVGNRLQRVENADATSTSTGTLGIWRTVYVTDSYVSFGDCKSVFTTRAVYTSNNYCRPYQIYGIKTSQTIKIKAIAMDVNTSADHCMLSDGETSVEEALFTIDTASTGSSTWASGTSAVVEIDVSKTGYVPKGIISIYKSGANNGYVGISGFYIDETTQKARITMYNPSSTSVTVTGVQVTVLYAKA